MIPRFRAWDKKEKCLADKVEVIRFPYDEILLHWDNPWRSEYFDLDDVVLMQSTGLKDKKGKEIFEGDILKVTDEHSWLEVVSYNDNKAMFVSEEVNRRFKAPESPLYELFNTNIFEIEVIGNIWENGELITNEQTKRIRLVQRR